MIKKYEITCYGGAYKHDDGSGRFVWDELVVKKKANSLTLSIKCFVYRMLYDYIVIDYQFERVYRNKRGWIGESISECKEKDKRK